MVSSDIITFPLEMPEAPAFREISWAQESVVAVNQSPFTLHQQVYAWPGQRHVVTIKLPPMPPDQGRKWFAFFGRLNGREGSFYVTDSTANLRRAGLPLGLPETDGDQPAGRMVASTGWTPATQFVARAGDWIQLHKRMHRVLDDVHSDADGKATFPVWPSIPVIPSGVAIEWRRPRGVFRLNDEPDMNQGVSRFFESVTFSATEVIA